MHQPGYGVDMPDQTAWSRYIDDTCGEDSNATIAVKLGVARSTIGRWRTGAFDPSPQQVVEYARAYRRSPAEALIAAGYLTTEDLDMAITVPTLTVADFSALALAQELTRRLKLDTTASDLFPFTQDLGKGLAHDTLFRP